jgi:carbon monoxide dehydrogenase subunit G
MKANFNKTFQVNEPVDKVWDYLSDPNKIVTCVPGASLVDQMDDDNYKGEVTLKFGPIKAKYAGQITFQERDNDNHKMIMVGKGLDSKGKGSADMTMHGSADEKDGGTEVNCNMEVSVTGMLAQFGSRLINDVTDSVFDKFVQNFKDKLAGKEVDNTMTAGSMIKGLFKK